MKLLIQQFKQKSQLTTIVDIDCDYISASFDNTNTKLNISAYNNEDISLVYSEFSIKSIFGIVSDGAIYKIILKTDYKYTIKFI